MKPIVIVPAFNEELNILAVVKDIREHTKYDYIIINDCSKDGTEKVCKENNLNYINLAVNYGLTSAVQTGFKYALRNGYDCAVQFDGDAQHKAVYLSTIFQKIEEGNDIVIGSRFVNVRKPLSARMTGSRIITLLIRLLTGTHIYDPTSGMRAFNKSTMQEYAYGMNYPPEPDTLMYMLKKKKKIAEVQVEMDERVNGESYLNPIRSLTYMLEMIISILLIQNFRKRG